MQESLLFKLAIYTQNYISKKKSLNYSINTINTYSLTDIFLVKSSPTP